LGFGCLSNEDGELGVRKLCEFNTSLLGKSWWGGGRPTEGRGRDCSVWWRMMQGIHGGVGMGVGSWFEDNSRRVVGDGSGTYFWTDN